MGLGGREDAERAWEERDQLVRSWGSGEGSPDAPPRSRASATLYREFFFPEGLGGFERPAPTAPALRDVARAAVVAFDAKCEEAVRARASGFGTGNGGGGRAASRGRRFRSAPPRAPSRRTARCSPAAALRPRRGVSRRRRGLQGEGAVLLAWVAEERGETRSNGGARKGAGQGPGPVRLRAVDDTGEMALEIAPDGEADDPGDRSASAAFDATKFTPGAMIAATRWRVVVEGSRESRRAGPGRRRDPPGASRQVRVARARAGRRVEPRGSGGPPSGAAARGATPRGTTHNTSSLPGSRPREESLDDRAPLLDVSDLLVWTPGAARRVAPRRVPAARRRATLGGGGPIDGGESPAGPPPRGPISSSRARWPPPPAVAPAFVARVVRDEYVADRNGGGGWQFVFRLVGGAGPPSARRARAQGRGGHPRGRGRGRDGGRPRRPAVRLRRVRAVRQVHQADPGGGARERARHVRDGASRTTKGSRRDAFGRREPPGSSGTVRTRLREAFEGRASSPRGTRAFVVPRSSSAGDARGGGSRRADRRASGGGGPARVGGCARGSRHVTPPDRSVGVPDVRVRRRLHGRARRERAAREAAARRERRREPRVPFTRRLWTRRWIRRRRARRRGALGVARRPGRSRRPPRRRRGARRVRVRGGGGGDAVRRVRAGGVLDRRRRGGGFIDARRQIRGDERSRRHGRVTARLASIDLDPDGPPGSGGRVRHARARGYAAQSVSEREGWPLLAAVGRAARLDEMLFEVALNYKRLTPRRASATFSTRARRRSGRSRRPSGRRGR